MDPILGVEISIEELGEMGFKVGDQVGLDHDGNVYRIDNETWTLIGKKKVKRYGLSQHRLASNPMEKAFSDAWHRLEFNGTPYGEKILSNILSPDNHPVFVEEDTKAVAATVIQWLGSPVGQYFLEQVAKLAKGDD